jgi:hypothetical protein
MSLVCVLKAHGTRHFIPSEFARGENADVDTVIRNIHIHIMRVLLLNILIRTIINCDYYSLSAYEVIRVLDYYLNLYIIMRLLQYASLNKLRFNFFTQFMIINHRESLFHTVIGIWNTQRKKKKKKKRKEKKKRSVVRYDFEMIVKKS